MSARSTSGLTARVRANMSGQWKAPHAHSSAGCTQKDLISWGAPFWGMLHAILHAWCHPNLQHNALRVDWEPWARYGQVPDVHGTPPLVRSSQHLSIPCAALRDPCSLAMGHQLI